LKLQVKSEIFITNETTRTNIKNTINDGSPQ
jgi:hypothetical protein